MSNRDTSKLAIKNSNAKVSACGSDINTDDDIVSINYKGKIIYFCEKECKIEFIENPEKFLDSSHFTLSFELLEDE